jgi:Tfp pilus assembly protein PilV
MTPSLSRSQAGSTLPEVMISALILAVFFASIFEVNGICLRYISATKDNVAAIEGVQDRLEATRALAFADLKTESYMKTFLTTPANASTFAGQVATETVTLSFLNSDYTTGSPSVTYTRTPGASIVPTVSWSGGASFPATTTLVKARVQYTWNMSLTGRSRTEMTETIISDGVKK